MKLPHLHPILFVDSHAILDDKDITAKYTVPHDHPVLKGHFPHFPIWPGIHLIEGCSQTAGLHAMHSVSTDIDENFVAMVASIEKGSYMYYDCVVYNGGTRVAQAYVGLTATKNG